MNTQIRAQKSRLARTIVLGLAGILAACGGYAAGTPSAAERIDSRIIRDPDNPAWTGMAAPVQGAGTSVIRDPADPYWEGSETDPALRTFWTSTPSGLR